MVRMSLPGVEHLTTCKHPQRRKNVVRKSQLIDRQGQEELKAVKIAGPRL